MIRKNSDWLVPATIDKFVDRFFNESFENQQAGFVPCVDIAETEKSFEIQMAIPGLDKKDFNIDIKEGLLTVGGERKLEEKRKEKNFHTIQTQYGTFRKSFQLPESVEQDKIEASYENGILNITIPKDQTKKLVSKITVK